MLNDLMNWFAGGSPRYMTLYHCMNGDLPWIVITVVLDLAVAAGYIVIAIHWWREQRGSEQGTAQRALANMKTIFIFCGICGYIFIPIKMFWPAWRLYDLFLLVLVVYTWRYAWNARELKVVYHQLTRTAQLARDVERLTDESERKTFFLNSVSHDLRTPLNGIVLQAQLAEMYLEDLNPESEQTRSLAEALQAIQSSAHAAAGILNSFLEVSRLDWSRDDITPTTFGLAELLQWVVHQLRIVADQKGLSLHAEAPAGLMVQTDRNKLERILVNLVTNGIKYTNEGGVRIAAISSGGIVTIHVIDSGIGIEAHHIPHLFDEFYQVRNPERDGRKGHGLGLSIARRLARQLGGDLSAESTVGAGSQFVVTLPGIIAGRKPDAPSEVATGRG